MKLLRKRFKPSKIFYDPNPGLEWLNSLHFPGYLKRLVNEELKDGVSFGHCSIIVDGTRVHIPVNFKELLHLTKAYPWLAVERRSSNYVNGESYSGAVDIMTLFDFFRSLILFTVAKADNQGSTGGAVDQLSGPFVFSDDRFAYIKGRYTMMLFLEILQGADLAYLKSYRQSLMAAVINDVSAAELFTETAALKQARGSGSFSDQSGLLLVVQDEEAPPSFLPDDAIFEAFLLEKNLSSDSRFFAIDKKDLHGVSTEDVFKLSPKVSLDTLNPKFSSDLMILNMETLYPSTGIPGFPAPDFNSMFIDGKPQMVYLETAFKRALAAHDQVLT